MARKKQEKQQVGLKNPYRLTRILATGAHYNLIVGERSNGKTFAALEYGIQQYVQHKKQTALVRRWTEDITGKRGSTMFDGITSAGVIQRETGGEWTGVYYYASKWYLCRYDQETGKRIQDETPFCYGFAVSAMEHDKSTSYPNVTTIIFDEFITRGMYLPDEFVLFCNVVSTIVRYRNDVKIFMLGNSVSINCPYYQEMGLTHIRQQEEGTIDLYRYGESDLLVAVERTAATKQGKESDLYFAFDNPKLQMITGGTWEMEIYPHCPVRYKPNEILLRYFIKFNEDLLQCEIVLHEDMFFTFIFPKTSELKDPEKDIIFSPEYSARPNWKRNITKPQTPIEKKIASFYIREKVFYSDNTVGEIVRGYLNWCTANG